MNTQSTNLLIGNTFPITHIRRVVHFTPQSLPQFQAAAANSIIYSFWGHPETLKTASAAVGFDLTPDHGNPAARPVLGLSNQMLPLLNGIEFTDCWVVSPNYKENLRPPAGQAIVGDNIASWQVLHLTWP